jgi:ribosome recycling factor
MNVEQIYKDSKAMLNGHFLLSSGNHSSVYLQSAKGAKVMTDNAKVAIRNIRKSSNDKIKKLNKDKEINDDENKAGQNEIQKITDTYVTKADAIFKEKEAEILKV